MITAGAPAGTTVEFSWPPVPGAQSYIVDYAIGAGAYVSLDPKLTTTSVKVTGKTGNNLKVRVQAAADTAVSTAAISADVPIIAAPVAPVLSHTVNGGPWQIRARNQTATSAIFSSPLGDLVEVRVSSANYTGSSATSVRTAQL